MRGEIVHFVVEEVAARRRNTGTIEIVERVGVGDGVAGGVNDGEVCGVAVAGRFGD